MQGRGPVGRLVGTALGSQSGDVLATLGPGCRRDIYEVSLLSEPNPGPRDMASDVNNNYSSLTLSTCSVPGPSCDDYLAQIIIITQEEGVVIPIFQMKKLRIREVKSVAQGPQP